MEIAYFILGGFILFLIIANAVKLGMKEALSEFKEDIMKEIDIKKANDKK